MNTIIKKNVDGDEVGEIIHDLSNAMFAIKGLLRVIQACEDPVLKEEKILRAIERVKLAEDYLTAKRSHRDFHLVDLAKVLGDVIPYFKGVYPGIETSLEIMGHPSVQIDTSLFFNVLSNLFKNSLEAGASEFRIQVSDTKLVVSDNGPGITPDVLAKIKAQGSSKGEGRGVGLQSIARFCLQSKWEMELDNKSSHSQNDHGLVVSFRWS